MASKHKSLTPQSSAGEIDRFLRAAAALPASPRQPGGGRLIFALDATASREPTWDQACHIQAEMFAETAGLGGLNIQLCYFRGFGEFEVAPWAATSAPLIARMTGVRCRSGRTQIERVLDHAVAEAGRGRVNALVYVGDCMEESPDRLCQRAGQLGLLGVPAFLFQEGVEPIARRTFQQIARLTGGAYCRFDAGSAQSLRSLLAAVAVYAAGGRPALANYAKRAGADVLRLTQQLQHG